MKLYIHTYKINVICNHGFCWVLNVVNVHIMCHCIAQTYIHTYKLRTCDMYMSIMWHMYVRWIVMWTSKLLAIDKFIIIKSRVCFRTDWHSYILCIPYQMIHSIINRTDEYLVNEFIIITAISLRSDGIHTYIQFI